MSLHLDVFLYTIRNNPPFMGAGGQKTGKRGDWGIKKSAMGKADAISFQTFLVNGFHFFVTLCA
jgi:hypothetical protein